MLGEVPDYKIAEKADVSRITVLKRRSEKNIDAFRSQINEKKASKIKWLARNTDLKQPEIASRYGTSKENVSAIKNGRSWKNVNAVKPSDL